MQKALLVGINYTGTIYELQGCINDVNNIREYLLSKDFDDIEILTEKNATTQSIISGLRRLTKGVKSGDVIVFYYSGHGSQLPSKDEEDGFEEIICPIDLDWKNNVITDNTLRLIFSEVPDYVNTTVILDCCHAGSMLDHTHTLEDIDITTENTGTDKQFSSKFLRPPAYVEDLISKRSLVQWSTANDINKFALLIAGCKSNQTSADAFIDNQYQGAATAALLGIIKSRSICSYKDLIIEMRKYMKNNGYSQEPVLDGRPELYNHIFLNRFSVLKSNKIRSMAILGFTFVFLLVIFALFVIFL